MSRVQGSTAGTVHHYRNATVRMCLWNGERSQRAGSNSVLQCHEGPYGYARGPAAPLRAARIDRPMTHIRFHVTKERFEQVMRGPYPHPHYPHIMVGTGPIMQAHWDAVKFNYLQQELEK